MALKIVWTPQAKKGYLAIVDYLSQEWSEKEVKNFVKQTFKFFDQLSEYPNLLKESKKKKIRSGPINKHTILVYRVKPRKGEIQLLYIRGSRQKALV